jgi:PadR family transcriptional regulator PadR
MHDIVRYRESMDLNGWKAQLRKGAAELVVLATLGRKDTYGIDLLERINATGGLDLSEGSIYPLLNRLHKEGKIRGRWVEDPEATHPRKYYGLTDDGRLLLAEMLGEWAQFEAGMHQVLGMEVGRESR